MALHRAVDSGLMMLIKPIEFHHIVLQKSSKKDTQGYLFNSQKYLSMILAYSLPQAPRQSLFPGGM